MSELKARRFFEVVPTSKEGFYQPGAFVDGCLKSEADKVIAHQKYKRCLAMAEFCYTNVHCIMGHRLCSFNDRTKEWYERWYKRWLELAEVFK